MLHKRNFLLQGAEGPSLTVSATSLSIAVEDLDQDLLADFSQTIT
ncbi:hypothetical protein OG432_18630 [Streptomyces sp. NBC_00442]